jgi:hypothetical protein
MPWVVALYRNVRHVGSIPTIALCLFGGALQSPFLVTTLTLYSVGVVLILAQKGGENMADLPKIPDIPLEQLLDDLVESAVDAERCRLALMKPFMGTIEIVPLMSREKGNKKIIKVIREEIAKRMEAKDDVQPVS